MKKVAILGSTGSIGTQALDVVRQHPDKLSVVSLVAYSSKEKLKMQAEEFHPQYCALISQQGPSCLTEAVEGCDVAVVATKGITALRCVLYCLEKGIDVCLANKETLVCGGEMIMSKVGKSKLIPVDSEHSAIWQCLKTNPNQHLSRILLTASGGPFFELNQEQLKNVTAADALKHPNWSMGSKITVDSATMFNKALEVVEAHHLFGVPYEKIEIVVHRQSIVHSMVEWQSGSVVAQMALPDMHLPIQLALLGEGEKAIPQLDFANLLTLTFQKCDFERFPCASLGYQVAKLPPLAATVMNAANDVCVEQFLAGKLSFDKFYPTITQAVEVFLPQTNLPLTVDNVEICDRAARLFVRDILR